MYIFIFLCCSIVMRCYCELEPYAVGGDYVQITNYPHAIYLSVMCGYPWICGGSILNQRMILTAAHCVDGCNLNRQSHTIEAYAGHENLEKVQTRRFATRFAIHAQYDEVSVANDIALVLLRKNFPLGNNIKRVIIPRRFSPDMRKGSVAGWGIINDYTEEESIKLKKVQQLIRSKDICAMIGKMGPGMYCAGSTRSNADHPSRGDSGSGMVTPRFEEIGLVSFRVNRLPALMVYTNVSYYNNWINTQSKRLFCGPNGK